MPNTPALVGEGASAISGGSAATDDDLAWAEAILGGVGLVVRVAEGDLDAVTGLSGSGPAYVFLVAEALVDAAVDAGLSPELASTLTTQLLVGSAKLLAERGDPAALRAMVTSPGGTTAAGLRVLEERGVRAGVRRGGTGGDAAQPRALAPIADGGRRSASDPHQRDHAGDEDQGEEQGDGQRRRRSHGVDATGVAVRSTGVATAVGRRRRRLNTTASPGPSASSAAADRRSRARAYMPWLSSTRPTVPAASSPNVVASRALRRSSPQTTVTTSPSRLAAAGRQGGELVGPDVELAVAEAVDPQHLGVDAVGLRPRQGDDPGTSRALSSAVPSSARSTPLHRWAAAGANTSRPANVAPGASNW